MCSSDLGQDLIATFGEVVVDRAARSAAAGQYLVDGDSGGSALAQHLRGADQHVGTCRTSLGARFGRGGRQNKPPAESVRSGRARIAQLRRTPAEGARTEMEERSAADFVRKSAAGEVDLNDPHRVPPYLW